MKNVIQVVVIGVVILFVGITLTYAYTLLSRPHTMTGPSHSLSITPTLKSERSSSTNTRSWSMADQADLINNFTVEMFRRLINPSEDRNNVLSPFNVYAALLLAYEGADGSTREEMAEVMEIDTTSDFCQNFKKLLHALNLSSGEAILEVSFSGWLQKDFLFKDEYMDTVANCYAADLRSVDFISDWLKTVESINKWVEEETRNYIKELIPEDYPGHEMIRAILVSTLFLNASWSEKFVVIEEPSHFWTGAEYINATMMSAELPTKVYLGDGLTAVELPYSKSNLSMVIIIPEDLESFSNDMSWGRLSTILKALLDSEPKQARIIMPKFKIESARIELKPILSSMGIREVFDPFVSDLTKMAHVKKGDLYIDEVLHKAYIEVNEEGTIAAAATAVVVKAIAYIPPEVVIEVDRPFIFFIVDKSSGLIIFAGYVTHPAY